MAIQELDETASGRNTISVIDNIIMYHYWTWEEHIIGVNVED